MINLDFEKQNGLIPAIAQDFKSREVLMMAYINKESWELSLESGIAHYWSRSRQKIWKKGETSGNIQQIMEIRIDCDSDTVLLLVNQKGGAACHEGYSSCFFRQVKDGDPVIIAKRIFNPDDVYSEV
jgi:phosphoribosyl-AMP cyclohydrolase